MEINIQFVRLDASEALSQYLRQRLTKLDRYELKPSTIKATFTADRYKKVVELHFHGVEGTLHAKAESKDFRQSVDAAIKKMMHQLDREKKKVQQHKNPDIHDLKRAA